MIERSIRTSPRPKHTDMAMAVAEDIKRIMQRDRRLHDIDRPGLEFLLSMGLLVKDPGDRVSFLCEAAPFTLLTRTYK